jgi:hypothetical protein
MQLGARRKHTDAAIRACDEVDFGGWPGHSHFYRLRRVPFRPDLYIPLPEIAYPASIRVCESTVGEGMPRRAGNESEET